MGEERKIGNKEQKTPTTCYKFESYLNSVCHILNGAVAIYIFFLGFKLSWNRVITWHICLTTIGYQFMMTEAILVLYAPNSWSHFHTQTTKRHLHWVLQIIAFTFIVTGNSILIAQREQTNSTHFQSIHSCTG